MTMKVRGLNFEIDDGYFKLFGKTAMSIDDDVWLHPGTKGFVEVETKNIIGGIETCLEMDRKNGVIDRLSLIEMTPEFAFLVLQKRELLPVYFEDATEGDCFIRLPNVRFGVVETAVSIYPRLPVAMRTVDAAGAAL